MEEAVGVLIWLVGGGSFLVFLIRYWRDQRYEVFKDSAQNFAYTFLSQCNDVRQSSNPNDYIDPIAEGFASVASETIKRQVNTGDETYERTMAIIVVDAAISSSAERHQPFGYFEVVSQAVISAIIQKHPTYSSKYDGFVRTIVNSMSP